MPVERAGHQQRSQVEGRRLSSLRIPALAAIAISIMGTEAGR